MQKGKQPFFGLGGWAIEWITAVILYLFGLEVLGWSWLQVTTVVLLALFFAFWFADFDNWPFSKLGLPGMGIGVVAVSFILGWITWEYLAYFGWEPYTWGFPLILTLYFMYLVVSMSFENVHLEDLSIPKKAFVNFVLYFFIAYLILKSARVAGIEPLQEGVPAHWFPIAQFYFLGFGAWITQKMKHPAKGIVNLFIVLFVTLLYVATLIFTGVPDIIVTFNPEMIAWVAVLSATGVPLYVFLANYPWRKLKQPYMGLVGLILLFVVGAITFYVLEAIVGIWYSGSEVFYHMIALSFCAVTTEFMMAFSFMYGVPECFATLAGEYTEE